MQAKEFGEYLRQSRKKRGLTIRQVETYSGVSNSYLSQIENGKRGIPSAKTLKKLAPVLKESYEELMRISGQGHLLSQTFLKDVSKFAKENSQSPEQKIETALSEDPELYYFWNELSKREDLQLLFKQIKDLSPKSIKKIIKVIKVIEEEETLES